MFYLHTVNRSKETRTVKPVLVTTNKNYMCSFNYYNTQGLASTAATAVASSVRERAYQGHQVT